MAISRTNDGPSLAGKVGVIAGARSGIGAACARALAAEGAAVVVGFHHGAERARKAAATPLGRVVMPDDVALAVLASITHLRTRAGTPIVIDGGHSL